MNAIALYDYRRRMAMKKAKTAPNVASGCHAEALRGPPLKTRSIRLHVWLSPLHLSHASYVALSLMFGSGLPSQPTHVVARPPQRSQRSCVCLPLGTPVQSTHLE